MTDNVFDPPRSNVERPDGVSNARTKAIAAGFVGVLSGYLLWAQWLALPVEWVKPLLPLIKALTDDFSTDFRYNVALASLVFVTSMPNTLLIAAICAYAIRFSGKMRLTLYSALIWPALLFGAHWLKVAYRTLIAASRGFDPETIYLIESADFSAQAMLIFLVYGLFLLVAFLLARKIRS